MRATEFVSAWIESFSGDDSGVLWKQKQWMAIRADGSKESIDFAFYMEVTNCNRLRYAVMGIEQEKYGEKSI